MKLLDIVLMLVPCGSIIWQISLVHFIWFIPRRGTGKNVTRDDKSHNVPLLRCRTASKSITEAAADTFKEAIFPSIGMRTS